MCAPKLVYGQGKNKPQSVGLSDGGVGFSLNRKQYGHGGGYPVRNAISQLDSRASVWNESNHANCFSLSLRMDRVGGATYVSVCKFASSLMEAEPWTPLQARPPETNQCSKILTRQSKFQLPFLPRKCADLPLAALACAAPL